MKRFFIVTLLCAAVGVASAQNTENVAFKWAFGALTGPTKAFVPITRDTVLRSGDEIKMLVELVRECYVYVVYEGPNGELSLLFPYDLKQFASDYETGKNYYIPKGRSWLTFDKTAGKEKFYILASNERLTQLEALLSSYQTADKATKRDAGSKVVAEIRDVRKRFRTFTTLAEKPVTIGGNVRGVGEAAAAKRPDVADIATAITASNFYAKTFTIDHR
jgi:hypothetical protein